MGFLSVPLSPQIRSLPFLGSFAPGVSSLFARWEARQQTGGIEGCEMRCGLPLTLPAASRGAWQRPCPLTAPALGGSSPSLTPSGTGWKQLPAIMSLQVFLAPLTLPAPYRVPSRSSSVQPFECPCVPGWDAKPCGPHLTVLAQEALDGHLGARDSSLALLLPLVPRSLLPLHPPPSSSLPDAIPPSFLPPCRSFSDKSTRVVSDFHSILPQLEHRS